MREIRSILFIELLGGIGDLVIALPAIHAIAQSYPTAQLTVLTFAPGDELLTADLLIQRVICADKGAARQAVDQLLATAAFDLIVSDTNYDGIADTIHAYQASQQTSQKAAPLVVTNLWQSPPDDEFVGQRFLKILFTEGIITAAASSDKPEIYLTATEKLAARRALGSLYRPLVFLCPDAGMAIKRWSTANFVVLGKALQHRYGASIIVAVGVNLAEAEQIVQEIGAAAQVWQRGALRQLAAAMAEADLVIAGDTGIAHIAAALQVPTITLFGPSWAGRYGHPSPHMNLQGFAECPERIISNFTQQCCWYSNYCPFEWENCLADISPEMVLEATENILKPDISRFTLSSTQPSTPAFAIADSEYSSWRSVRNLLVMRLDNIGDVFMASPALRALKENLPQAKLTLMASPAGALTAPLLPWVDQVLPWRVLWQDLGKLGFDPSREWQLIETLKAHQFDAAIIFTSFSQSPHPAALICALANIPLRLGESKEQDRGTLTHAAPILPDEIHQVERNLHLIESVGFSVTDRRLTLHIPDTVQQTVFQFLSFQSPKSSLPNSQPPITHHPTPYLLLNPWTSCQSRNYPTDRFAVAARQLSEITGWSVVITGVAKDSQRASLLLKILGERAIDLIGATNLTELAALIAKAKLVLTNNTSVMHMADATQTPIIVMFAGTEQESQWQPRSAPMRLLRRSTVCSPCYSFHCPYELQCLDISSETVVEAALELLQKIGVAP